MNIDTLRNWLPFLIVFGLTNLAIWGLRRYLSKQPVDKDNHSTRQMIIIGAYVIGTLALLLALPVDTTTRGQLISFAGLILTALIALSSTTLVANAMAGFLIRIVDSFKPGDFIRVGEHFGRVTERGLFHTEIQTEDRDLTTMPNMQLITQPVTVVFKTGTVISAGVSLGYDVHHSEAEAAMLQAAKAAELSDPFVQVLELGDFSVSYRVGGRLQDVGSLLTARSALRRCLLDELHGAGIEIASPNIMSQRPLPPDRLLLPESGALSGVKVRRENAPKLEELVFDKAEQAGQKQALAAALASAQAELAEAVAADEKTRVKALERRVSRLQQQLDAAAAAIKAG